MKNNPGQIALDTVGVLPLIGVIKYGDEAALVIKKADGTIEKVITSKKLPQQAGRGQSKGGRHVPTFSLQIPHLYSQYISLSQNHPLLVLKLWCIA